MASKSLEQLMLYAIGGGWGDEQPGAGKVRVAVIRGTDIPKLRIGDHSSVPFRYESESKVRSRLLRVGDIVIEVSGGSAASGQHTGRSLLVTGEILQSLGGKVIPASFCRLLRLDTQQVHPGFVVLQIDSLHRSGEIAEFENQSTGIANFQFNRFVEETHPRIKELDAQATIVEYISSFDRLIALNRRINRTLEAMAQAIFKSWFVDFDPVKAKIAAIEQGQDPLRAAMRAISGKTDAELDQMPPEHHDQLAATAALFPDAMEESELGEIPKGWGIQPLDRIATYLNGLALQKFPPESESEFLPVIKIAQLRAGNTKGADRASARLKSEYIVEDGDVLFSWSGSLEVDVWTGGLGALNQHLFKVTSSHVPKWFYFFATKYYLPQFREIAANKATTMGHIQRKHLSDAQIAVPKLDVMRAASEVIAPIFSQAIALRLQSRQLAELRDTLLPALLSGELQVKKDNHDEQS